MIERLRALVGAAGVWSGTEEAARVAPYPAPRADAAPWVMQEEPPPAEAARWAVSGALPRAVVAPGSAEEAAAVFALATAEGWMVAPAGAGALFDSGRLPAAPDLVVTTERLVDIAAYEPADLVISVGAGTTLGVLRNRLAEEGQWLPLDPPGCDIATLGAVVATASAGPLRQGYGTPRDHILGLQLVTADGRILELGGRVVKNVAGYDLVKVVVGSQGTLGLVTRVDIRLRAIPESDLTSALAAASPELLIEVVDALWKERIAPVAVELLSPAAWRVVEEMVAAGVQPGVGERAGMQDGVRTTSPALETRDARRKTGNDWVLLIRLQGNVDAVPAAEKRVREAAEKVAGVVVIDGVVRVSEAVIRPRALAVSEAVSMPPAAGASEAVELPESTERSMSTEAPEIFGASNISVTAAQSRRGSLADGIASMVWDAVSQLEAGAAFSVRLADRPSALRETLQLALGLPGGDTLPLVVHAGAGIVCVLAAVGPGRSADASVDEWIAALTTARANLVARRGTLIVTRAPAEVATAFDPVGAVGPGVTHLLHGIRERFDPAGTLAPGRAAR